MAKKEGKFPCNCRVDVDYTGKKPKIKFGYANKHPKKDAVRQAGNMSILFFIWGIIGILPFFYFFLGGMEINSYPEECGNITFDSFNYNKSVTYTGDMKNYSFNRSYKRVYGFNITCDNVTHQINYFTNGDFMIKPHFSEDGYKSNLSPLILIGMAFLWLYISLIPAIYINRKITRWLITKKWYQRWLPKANADGVLFKRRKKKYRKFYSKDVLSKIIIIPEFANVELDYKTNGDFSKYLERITIREYKEQKIKVRSRKTSKLKVDVFKWYAIFYFKEEPKDGFMEVIYQ